MPQLPQRACERADRWQEGAAFIQIHGLLAFIVGLSVSGFAGAVMAAMVLWGALLRCTGGVRQRRRAPAVLLASLVTAEVLGGIGTAMGLVVEEKLVSGQVADAWALPLTAALALSAGAAVWRLRHLPTRILRTAVVATTPLALAAMAYWGQLFFELAFR